MKEEISCGISMHSRMPRSILWAPQGGISPNKTINQQLVTCTLSTKIREGQDQAYDHQPHSQDQQDGEPPDDQGEDQQHQPHIQDHQDSRSASSEEEIKAVTPACLDRMPGPIVQASLGGTSPRTINKLHMSNHHSIGGKQEEDQQLEEEEAKRLSLL